MKREEMRKEEYERRYGKEAYKKLMERIEEWRMRNPEKRKQYERDQNRKDGKRYTQKLGYNRTGLAGARNRVRSMHRGRYLQYKKIIAPNSVLHHQWRPGSADYDGVALVEEHQHQYGVIDVIQILKGVITLATEREIRER